MATNTDTGLQKVTPDLPAAPVQSIEGLKNTWARLSSEANLVTPLASVDSIQAMHAVSLRAVIIDAAVNNFGQGSEVYRDRRFCEENERALGGVALQKIAAAAGVQILSRKRVDDRSEPYYCEVEVTIAMRDFDGTYRQVTKAREVDLRDGSPETTKPEKKKVGARWEKTGKLVPLDPSALADKRRHIQSLAETKAFYRALRTLLQLKQKYTLEELARPFVVPKLVPMLDPNDPDQKDALIRMALGQEASLYGHDGGRMRETKDVTPSSQPRGESAPDPSTGTQPEAPAVNQPAEDEPDEADFEPLDLPEEEPPPAATCGCICGCQLELTEKIATMTTERCGAPRCGDCYPGRRFDSERHRGLGDLKLPKHQGLTAERIEASLKGGVR